MNCATGKIEKILREGKERVEKIAAPTLDDFRNKLGLVER